MLLLSLIAGVLVVVFGPSPALAVPTRITVRARAHDAKFVGTAVGGLEVGIKDFYNGRMLATGTITGGTGDTRLLMMEPMVRGRNIATPETAGFAATLDIDRPVKLLIELSGPMSAGECLHRESKTVWLIPGQDMTGDGVVFDLYGLIVAPYTPAPHEIHKLGDTIKVAAHISPMCGCPIGPGSLWDAGNYEVKATVLKDGRKIAELPMNYAGSIGDFAADYKASATGTYQFVITASDQRSDTGAAVRGAVVIGGRRGKSDRF
ncbi:MAG: hypothetical protein P8Y63_09350, partial [Deltaproteobacteria bacterium]